MNTSATLENAPETEAETADAVEITHAVTTAGKGFIAAVETVAQDPEDCIARLVKFRGDGSGAKTLVERRVSETAAEHGLPVAARMPATGALIGAINDGENAQVELLGTRSEKLSKVFDKAAIGNVADCAANKKFAVILTDNLDKNGLPVQDLHLLKTTLKAPKIALMDLEGLRLNLRRRVSAMTFWKDMLYIAVADALAGFDLFKVDLAARKPVAEAVISRGAHRFSLNASVPVLLATSNALLIGTAALATTEKQLGNWGAELIALDADGHWQIVFGQHRLSPDGLKRPVAEADAGIGSPENSAVVAMAVRGAKGAEEVVFALQEYWGDGTWDRETVVPDMTGYFGGVRFFKSAPGGGLADWEELEIDLPEDRGSVSSLCFSSAGLVIGHEKMGAEGAPVTVAPLE